MTSAKSIAIAIIALIVGVATIISLSAEPPAPRVPPTINGTTQALTAASVAAHATPSDCWTIIGDNIYDLSEYITSHPGGPVITKACGTNGTILFDTKDGAGRPHSDFANELLAQYYIGTVGQVLPSSNQTNSTQTAPSTTTTTQNTSVTNTTVLKPANATTNQTTCVDVATLAKHASATSCWLSISGKAYDVTKYLPLHPGGKAVILTYCGAPDATNAFDTKDGSGGKHSSFAKTSLASYLVAPLCPTTVVTLTATITAPTANQQFVNGTTSTTLSATTNVKATCKWETSDTTYPKMSKTFATTGTTSHTTTVTGLADGKSYTRYVRCKDELGQEMLTSAKITFSVEQGIPVGTILDAATVALHDSKNSCWLIISGKVYDVTTYIPIHPGGSSAISSRCGTDATDEFDTKGGGGTHSSFARGLLSSYLLGPLVIPTDITPPTATIVLPLSGQVFSGGTTTVTLQVTTNEAAGCRWSTTDQAYSAMATGFTTTGATTHVTTVGSLANGQTYTRYVRCSDTAGNNMTTSASVTFSVSNVTDATPPVVTVTAPTTNQVLAVGTTSTALSATSNEASSCRWSTTDQAYSAMTNTFTTTGGTTHTTSLTSLTNGQTYTRYIRCSDTVGNNMTTSATASFSVAALGGYTLTQVATHNTQGNCWIVVSGEVYDVTSYIAIHPGGAAIIVNNCGTDATTAFNTKGGSGATHSSGAQNLLAGYKIGTLTDTTAPTATIQSPVANQQFTAGTTSTTMSVATNEAASCRWSTTDQAYSAMTNTFTTTGGTTHTTTLTSLTNGQAYTRYVRCSDATGNAMAASASVSFSVSTVADATPPTATITAPTANQQFNPGTTSTALSATTNEAASCKWSTADQAYSAMTNTFTTTGGTTHTTTLTSLTNGQTYTRYIRCSDTVGNNMTTSASVSFSVSTTGTYTLSQVAQHNTQTNCWIIVGTSVYDVTAYIPIHPGGAGVITSRCGTDATTAFNTKGGTGNSHSNTAQNLLATYRLGSLSTVDTTPPVATITAPGQGQQLGSGTTSTTLAVVTDEAATCKFGTTDASYASLANTFTTTGSTSHSATISGLANGQAYTYYVRCQDKATTPNVMTTSVTRSFSVSDTADTTAPTATITAPTAGQQLGVGTTSTTLSVTTDESATCKYGATDASYASMTSTFTTTGTTSHSTTISGLANGQAYTRYVRCSDTAGNVMATSASVAFSVAAPPTYTLAQIATHNTMSSCWIVIQTGINNGVFDMSSFGSIHPGGREAITKNCGKNATRTFDRQDGHGNSERQILNSYFIGNVG